MRGWVRRSWIWRFWGAPIFHPEVPNPFKNHDGSNPHLRPSELTKNFNRRHPKRDGEKLIALKSRIAYGFTFSWTDRISLRKIPLKPHE